MRAPAARLAALRPSLIRAMAEGAPPGAILLGLGEPTWPLPEPARLALRREPGPCPYAPHAGLPELRRAVASYYRTDIDQVLVTAGSQGALFGLLQAWVEPGARVLHPDPGFPAYPALARLAGAEPVPYPLGGNRYRLDASALLRVLAATPWARAVIVNAPGNPTGGGASREDLRLVAEACAARDILLVADEVYKELYTAAPLAGLREASPFGVVVSSVSKGWGAPGLRVGWAVGDPRWLEPAKRVHAYAVTAAATTSQWAALALLERSAEVLAAARAALRERWEVLAAAFRAELGHDPAPPDGAFYHFLPLPESGWADPLAFAMRLRDEAGVVLIPGLAFGEGGRRHARLSFAAPPEHLAEGVRRLAPWFRG